MTKTGKITAGIILFVIVILALLLIRQPGPGTTDIVPTITPTTKVESTFTPVTATPGITVSPTAAAVTATVAPSASGTAVTTPPASWKPLVNDAQGYTAYRPGNWYYRFFPPNKDMLSIDPNPVPEASSYAGVIHIRRLGSTNEYTEFKNSLTPGYTTSTVTYNGHDWTIIKGSIPASEISDKIYVKAGYVKIGSKEFLAQLQSGAANYGGFEDEFDIFISTIIFN